MIPLQWVTATLFMYAGMLTGAPVPVVLIAGALGYLLSPRYKTNTTEKTKMSPEQEWIRELERQLAMQGEALEAIADAVEELADAADYSFYSAVGSAVERMRYKVLEMKENTL